MFVWFLLVLFVIFAFYILYNSFTFQIFYREKKLKHIFLDDLILKVKGDYFSKGYFTLSNKIIFSKDYKGLSKRVKKNYALCYGIVKFKTIDAKWEIFFHLVKDNSIKFSQIMTIRCFPNHCKIHSEGNIEKSYSRVNIFTNNQYLSNILEEKNTRHHLNLLMRNTGDIFLILPNNSHYNVLLNKNLFSSERVFEMVKAINYVKNRVYKSGVKGY